MAITHSKMINKHNIVKLLNEDYSKESVSIQIVLTNLR